MMFLAVLLLAAAASTEARYVWRQQSPGNCTFDNPKQDFDAVPYLGGWYEQQRFSLIWEGAEDCVQAIYSDLGEGYVEVHNVARKTNGERDEIIGQAHSTRPGVLLVEFFGHIPAEYHILETDYENFASVYNCVNLPFNQKVEYAWLLSRRPILEQEYVDQGLQVLADNDIDVSLFHDTHQGDDCDYFSP
ncbi:unnamed protein product [Meganyctiphanes norvegica]|uniref:Lipocalin/cytosolic fatty-acid binding domain-containing protein n=1 Tax=Meganyctiphanes norvegica TaxID=48144 RepID=A0AAV2S854_MEGNR